MRVSNYINNPQEALVYILQHYGGWISDKLYLKWLFRLTMGKKLDLRNPKTFSEKIQWLKLYDRKPEYTTMVDKVAVKEYVAEIIGQEYIIPMFGVWNKVEDIDWNSLPDQFVLKTTHGGGAKGVVVCKDKSGFDIHKAEGILNTSMKLDNIYRSLREWPYKNIKKRIFAEQYIKPEYGEQDLTDYKWYCFHGEPKYCQVIQDRNTNETIDFFDTGWIHQEFVGLNPSRGHRFSFASIPPEQPRSLKTQIELAKKLSHDIPFSRIDLYEVNNRVYFGEITFYPMSGLGSFFPTDYNTIIGDLLLLPKGTSIFNLFVPHLQTSRGPLNKI